MEHPPTIEQIFHGARALPAGAARDAYLDRACGDDQRRRARVLDLLRADAAVDAAFLARSRTIDPRVSAETSVAGRTIGPYRLLAELGRGAQATVYLAEHERLRRRVALKVLHASLLGISSSVRERFRREAEVTANFEHPGICSVYETGESDGATWIAMQFVPGRTLADLLQERAVDGAGAKTVRLPVPRESTGSEGSTRSTSSIGGPSDILRVVAFLEHAARALHAAHERGLVHRDIKPGNLMVTDDGRPVVLDFGIAQTTRDDSDGPGLTRTTDVLGTPHYMSPEQLRAAATVDGRADVYALGVTAYECLTSARPFDAPSRESLYRAILTAEPSPPRALDPRIPRDLEVVLLTALEKDRDRRYRTALDFAEDLRRVRQHEPIRARPVSPLGRLVRWSRRSPLVAASLALAFVSLTAGLAASLCFLEGANQALRNEQRVRAAWYDDLSREVAAQDMRCEVTLLQAQLMERSLSMLEADVPDLRARLEAAADRVSGSRTWSVDHPHARASVVEEIGDQLTPASGVCASDWLHLHCRQLISECMSFNTTDEVRAGLERFARLAVEHLDALRPDDLRVVRARLFWLDVLLDAGEADAAASRAQEFLDSDATVQVTRGFHDSTRSALYRSRLGAARLAQGRIAEARELLRASLEPLAADYPETWFVFRAQAQLLQVHDQLGEHAAAEALRWDLARGMSEQTNCYHTALSHWTPICAQAAVGPHRADLWHWFESIVGEVTRGALDLQEIERRAAELEVLLLRHHVAPDDPVRGILYLGFFNVGSVGVDRGYRHEVVARCFQLAADLVRDVPSAKASELYLTLLTSLGEEQTKMFRLDEAEARFDEALDQDRGRPGTPVWSTTLATSRGRLLVERGQFEAAEELLGKALEANLEWFGPYRGYGHNALRGLIDLHRVRGRFDQVEKWHQRQLEMWGLPEFRMEHAFSLLAFGRHERADSELEALRLEHPRNGRALRLHALNALVRGDHVVAEQRALAGLDAGVRSCERVLARAILARGDAAGAIPHFERAAAVAPDMVDGSGFWRDYGLALAATGRSEDADRMLLDLVARRPGDPLRWSARADLLAEFDGAEWRQVALQCAERAAQGFRCRASVLAVLAKARYAAGHVERAIHTMRDLLAFMDGDAQWLPLARARAELAAYERRR